MHTPSPKNSASPLKLTQFCHVRFRFPVAALVPLLLLCSWAQQPKLNPLAPKPAKKEVKGPATTTPAHEMTEADVSAFLDGLMPLQLERNDIGGAVVAVVKDGKVLFAKGYGYADVATKKPVSADDTLFRPGSVSKLFTWTAVMQLVEQGKLDLDRDVNEYLDFKIPATYPQAITLRHIMTHTAGFGETAKDLFIRDTADLKPIGTYLKDHIPNRIFAPGTVPAYSNYATTLAGYIVQRVSGKPFDEYIAENIFKPLGMTKTTWAQPLPDNLKPLMSSGYKVASGGAKSFEVVQAWPAGSISTSAMDMTRFIIAHLQDGRYENAQILRPETAALMHSRQFGAHPDMNGMALGFYEESRNGHRIIGHGGDTVYFHSDLHLILDGGVGFFVSYNSPGKGESSERTELWQKFLERYFPYQPPAAAPVTTATADLREVSGRYMSSRRSQGNLLEALNPFGELKVSGNADGTISVEEIKDFSGQPRKLREIAPLVYRDVNGQEKMAFKRDAKGRLYLALDYPFFVFQRVVWPQGKPFNSVVLGGSIGIMVLALILWPVTALIRRHYGRKLFLTPAERRLRIATRVVCLLNLVFFGSLLALAAALDEPGALNSHLDPKLRLLQVIGLIGALGTVIVLYNAVQVWRAASMPARASAAAASSPGTTATVPASTPARSLWSKVFETLIALACLGFVWFAVYWNLLNFNLNF